MLITINADNHTCDIDTSDVSFIEVNEQPFIRGMDIRDEHYPWKLEVQRYSKAGRRPVV